MSVRRDADGRELDPLTQRINRPEQPQADVPDRVFYDEGVMLDAEDFRTEQAYHRGRLARGLLYLFGMGTVAGLRVRHRGGLGTDGEELLVEPGLAIDRFGRQIEVPRPACTRLNRWWNHLAATAPDRLSAGLGPAVARNAAVQPDGWPDDVAASPEVPAGVFVDVFLRFVECERGLTPAFASGPYDATDAVRPHRLRDGYELSLHVQPRADGLPVPPDPWQVARAALLGAGNPAHTLHTQSLDTWREGTTHFGEDGRPPRLPEHPFTADPTSVLLARVLVPARLNDANRVERRFDGDVLVNHFIRHRVAAPGLFTRPQGV